MSFIEHLSALVAASTVVLLTGCGDAKVSEQAFVAGTAACKPYGGLDFVHDADSSEKTFCAHCKNTFYVHGNHQ